MDHQDNAELVSCSCSCAQLPSSCSAPSAMSWEEDPNFLLLVHGYKLGLRRVQGDDGDANQILRYIIQDKEKKIHDIYQVRGPRRTRCLTPLRKSP